VWADVESRANVTVERQMKNCRVTVDPTGTPHTCDGSFKADQRDFVPVGEGGVEVNNIAPTVAIRMSALPVEVKTRDHVDIALQQRDGTFAAAVRYQVSDTMDDGFGWTRLILAVA